MNPEQDIDKDKPHFNPRISRIKAEQDQLQARATKRLPELRGYQPPRFNELLANMNVNRSYGNG